MTTTTNQDAKGDATIVAAWHRMGDTRQTIDALPDGDDRENELWEAFGRDEHAIQKVCASQPVGAEIQLWCNLLHNVGSNEDEMAALRRDLEWFLGREDRYDWTERLTLSAIRSLRSMQAA